MRSLKLGVVESVPQNRTTVLTILNNLGYDVFPPAETFDEAIQLLRQNDLDMMLLNIQVEDRYDGLEIARQINETHKIPFIFLTVSGDPDIIHEVKNLNPHAYIIYPFSQECLFAAIEIAFTNFTNQKLLSHRASQMPWQNSDFIFVKDGYHFHKVFFKDIVFMKSDGNYVTIVVHPNHKLMVRSTLNDFITQSPQEMFIRVHRGFSVNVGKIEKVSPTAIVVHGHKIPIGKSYKKLLYDHLGIFN